MMNFVLGALMLMVLVLLGLMVWGAVTTRRQLTIDDKQDGFDKSWDIVGISQSKPLFPVHGKSFDKSNPGAPPE